MSPTPAQVQAYLLDAARARSTTLRVGPFTAFLHPDPSPFLNFAAPDETTEGRRVPVVGAGPEPEGAAAVDATRRTMEARGRSPRFEFVLETAPDLPDALRKAGFHEETRVPVLACTRETWTKPPAVAELGVAPILPESPWSATRQFLLVQREAFGLHEPVPESAPEDVWRALGIHAGILASVRGLPAGTAALAPPHHKLAELVGVATLPEHHAMGVATFLAAALARIAHDTGLDAALIIPADEAAVARYHEAGFRPVATLVSWTLARAAGSQAPR